MKKLPEKIVLVAHICITFVFALLTALYVTNVLPQQPISENSVAIILLLVLAVVYIVLSACLLYINFSERVNVKRILLYYDKQGETRAKACVVDKIVYGCAKQVKELKVQKVKIRLDEKLGLVATVYVKVSAENMSESIAQLRNLLMDNFKDTLNFTFNAINFEISQLTKKYVADVNSKKKKVTTQEAEVKSAEVKTEDSTTEPQMAQAEFEVVMPDTDVEDHPTNTASKQPIEVEYEDVSEEK